MHQFSLFETAPGNAFSNAFKCRQPNSLTACTSLENLSTKKSKQLLESLEMSRLKISDTLRKFERII